MECKIRIPSVDQFYTVTICFNRRLKYRLFLPDNDTFCLHIITVVKHNPEHEWFAFLTVIGYVRSDLICPLPINERQCRLHSLPLEICLGIPAFDHCSRRHQPVLIHNRLILFKFYFGSVYIYIRQIISPSDHPGVIFHISSLPTPKSSSKSFRYWLLNHAITVALLSVWRPCAPLPYTSTPVDFRCARIFWYPSGS